MPLSDYAPLIGAGIGAATNELFAENNDRRQVKQDEKLGRNAVNRAKQMADYEQMLKMRMWKDTNYGAQLEEADKAGISKAALFGGGGGGIATTAGASVGGGGGSTAANSAQTQSANAGTILTAAQLGLMNAQKANIEADTEIKKAGAGKATAEATGQGIENTIKGGEEQIRAEKEGIIARNLKDFEEAEMATVRRQIQSATTEAQKDIIRREAIGKGVENALNSAKTKLTNTQSKAVAESISQEWERIKLEGRKVTAEELYKAAMEGVARKGVMIADDALEQKKLMDGVNTAIGIGGAIGGMAPTKTTTSGYSEHSGDYWETRTTKKY